MDNGLGNWVLANGLDLSNTHPNKEISLGLVWAKQKIGKMKKNMGFKKFGK